MKRIAASALMLSLLGSTVSANEFEPAMRDYLENHIRGWVNSQVIVEAVSEQNGRTSGLGNSQILEMDQTWRAEVGTADSQLVTSVLTHPASEFLRQMVEESGGVITEAFIMDSVGLNVAASSPTSDYWQGDEAKFTETYPHGAGAVHISEVEFDESTQSYQGQVSLTVVDPSTNAVIGAITVGLNAEALF